MTDPASARNAYKEHAAEVARRLRAAEEARRGLAEAEEERTAAYATVEEEWALLDRMEERAGGVWKELTTRFGPQAAGQLPDPAGDPRAGQDAAELLRDAHRRVREPVDYPITGRYVRMAALGFVAAVMVAAFGLKLASLLRDTGWVRLALVFGPVVAAPYVGHLAAKAWIRSRTSHEEREYAVDTAIAGAFGGAVVWLIAFALLIVRFVA